MKKDKASVPFFSDTNLINPETNPFRTILNSWKVSSKSVYEEKLAGLDKKKFFAYQPR